MTKLITFLSVFAFTMIFFQNSNKCNLRESTFGIYAVNSEDVRCLAKNSDKPNSIFFTFARWCVPCIHHLPDVMKIDQNYNADVYVLLVDLERYEITRLAVEMVRKNYPNAKILVIKDGDKERRKKKYKDFLSEITPPQFENINDMSKYIVLNNEGKTLLVTNWKDHPRDVDWKSDKIVLDQKVFPLLQKK